MKKLLLLLICLFVSFEVKSFETTIFCKWNKRIIYEENEKKIKEENYSYKDYSYINTGYEYFGNTRRYGLLESNIRSKREFDFFEFKKNVITNISDFSTNGKKRTHYFETKYDITTGKISHKKVNLDPDYGRIEIVESFGTCSEVVFEECQDEKILICSGEGVFYDQSKDTYSTSKEEKRYFLCKDKKILSQKPFSEYQRTYTDALEIFRYKETKSKYEVNLYDADRKIFRSIKLDRINLKIEDTYPLKNSSTFSGECKINKPKI